MNRQRILISSGMIQGGKSGVGRYVTRLVEKLNHQKTVFDFYVAGLNQDRKLFKSIPDNRWIVIPDKFLHGVKNLIWHQAKLPKILKANNIDLVHIPSYRRILWKSPIKQVATIHDCAPFHLSDKYDFFRRIFGTKLIPYMAKKCQHIISVSRSTTRDIEHFMKIPQNRITTILNGVDHDHFYPRTVEEIKEFLINKKQELPYFLYISRLEHPGKNHIRLINAFEKLRSENPFQIQLILGGADWHGSELIHQRIEESTFKNDIILLGFVSEDDIPYWFSGCKALIFPSLFEGFGLPVVEAMACGSLVATSNRGSLKEVGGDAAWFFNPEDEAEILQSLNEILSLTDPDIEKQKQLGLHHSNSFSWDNAARETIKIYNSILKIETGK